MLLVSFESQDGTGVLKMDQPLASFAVVAHFGARCAALAGSN